MNLNDMNYFERLSIHLDDHTEKTPLLEYLRLNSSNQTVRRLLYVEMPMHFKWNLDSYEWVERIK